MAEDARVRKTKQKLSAALVALLQEKAFSDVTPAQICEKAGINRSTFYRNYKNILQLKTEMENKILAGIQWSSLPTDSFSAKEKIEAQLGYLKENKDLFMALSATASRESIFDKVRERAIEVAKESIDQVPDAPGEEEYNNLCVFYISAVVGCRRGMVYGRHGAEHRVFGFLLGSLAQRCSGSDRLLIYDLEKHRAICPVFFCEKSSLYETLCPAFLRRSGGLRGLKSV